MQTDYQQFLNIGISIIPINYKDKRPNARLLPKIDNHPSWEPFKTRLPTEEELHTWFARPINYGVVMGWRDLVVIDFDDMAEYQNWLLWCNQRGQQARVVARLAYRVKTARGMHIYFRMPGAVNQKINKIDIKANGYVLGPGSIHPTGAVYTAMQSAFIMPEVKNLTDILPAPKPGLIMPEKPVINTVQADPADPYEVAMKVTGNHVDNQSIARIKAKFDILAFFPNARSIDNRYYHSICPFHDDQHVSLWIDRRNQVCKCWACMAKAENSIGVYARLNHIDYREAINQMGAKL
jgi:hypothetical protein